MRGVYGNRHDRNSALLSEPDDSMIECAIRAMELVIPEEKGSDEWGL